MKKKLNKTTAVFGITLMLASIILFVSCPIYIEADKTVDMLAIEDLSPPIAGEVPDTSVSPTKQWTVESISWSPQESPFEGEVVYTASITLKAKDGYIFRGVEQDSFTIEGATVTNPEGSGEITAVFLETEPKFVTEKSIPIVPVVGKEPPKEVDLSQFEGQVSWKDESNADVSGSFQQGIQYKADIPVTAKKGWKFKDGSTFMVGGYEATMVVTPGTNNKKGILNIDFKEPLTQITDIAISNPADPVVGETPNTNVPTSANNQWTAVFANWEDSSGNSYAASYKGEASYVANLELTAETGFTFYGLDESAFTKANCTISLTIDTNDPQKGAIKIAYPPTDPAQVSYTEITELDKPIAGIAPDTMAKDSEQWTVSSISWKNSSVAVVGNFKGEEEYTAELSLRATKGYTFEGVTAFTEGNGTASLTLGTDPKDCTVSVVFDETDPEKVSDTAINGLTAPQEGATPIETAPTSVNNQWTASTIDWQDADGNTASGDFEGAKVYTAVIKLSAAHGYTFEGVTTFTEENGATVDFEIDPAGHKKGTIKISFPPTSPTTITDTTIKELEEPLAGGNPDMDITDDSNQWNVDSVVWKDAQGNEVTNIFEAGEIYKAIIELSPESGYTFNGVSANSFNLENNPSGITITNSANSGNLTVTFPETTTKLVDYTTISGIQPVTMEESKNTIPVSTTQWVIESISWKDSNDATLTPPAIFVIDTTYTATINIKTKIGWKFVDNAQYSIDGINANLSITDGATKEEGTLSVTFPATEAVAINDSESSTISGLKIPETNKPSSSTITDNSDQWSAGPVTWIPNDANFLDNKEYTAEIPITAEENWTLEETSTFSIDGVDPSWISFEIDPADHTKGTIIISFPKTDATVSQTVLNGITAPEAGVAPLSSIDTSGITQWTVDSTVWKDPLNTTPTIFGAEEVYSFVIDLTAKTGFTFEGLTADSFSDSAGSAQSVSFTKNTENSKKGTLTLVYPVTNTTINDLSIDDLTAPQAAQQPDSAISSAQWTASSITWKDDSNNIIEASQEFEGEEIYSVTIVLTNETGYTFYGVAENSFKINGVTANNAANSGTVTLTFSKTNPVKVSNTQITGLTAPKAGDVPDTVVDNTAQWENANPAWKVTGGTSFAGTFSPGTNYTFTIELSALHGYTFEGMLNEVFTVSDSVPISATLTSVNGKNATLSIDFNPTEATVSCKTIDGILAPVVNSEPDMDIDDSTQWTVTNIVWKDSENTTITPPGIFAGEELFTATLSLEVKSGYTFIDLPDNTVFTTNQSSNSAIFTYANRDNGYVTITYPATEAAVVTEHNSIGITGLEVSVRSAIPDNTATTSSAQWTVGEVAWNPEDNPFKGGVEYTASIPLTATKGWKFEADLPFIVASADEAEINFVIDGVNPKLGTLQVKYPMTLFGVTDKKTFLINDYEQTMILVHEGGEKEVPLDASGTTGTINTAYWMADTEITNEIAVEALNWAKDRISTSSSNTAPNYFSDGIFKYAGEVVTDMRSGFIEYVNDKYVVVEGYENIAFTCINWYSATLICNWLTEMEDGNKDNLVYVNIPESDGDFDSVNYVPEDLTKTGYRLPRYEEWVYAARWQGDNPNNAVSGYSDPYFTNADTVSGATDNYQNVEASGSVCWYCDNYVFNKYAIASAGGDPEVPRSGNANFLGLYDMSGGRNEWCARVDNTGVGYLCGGSYWDPLKLYSRLLVGYQSKGYRLDLGGDRTGFRLVRSANVE